MPGVGIVPGTKASALASSFEASLEVDLVGGLVVRNWAGVRGVSSD